MRRSNAFASTSAAAVAFGIMLAPLAASAAPEVGTASGRTKPDAAAVIEPHEGATEDAVRCALSDQACATSPDVAEQRAYLVQTARPGGTMMRQGPDVAIGRLHPDFVARLAGAIREAREAGLTDAGIFSAYRPPAFGVGGFKDKFQSLHAYGLAVDMHGIGAPGSSEAKLWTRIAAKHGVACPYGVNNPVEWNHCQPTRIKVIKSDSPLRQTISREGPVNRASMFEAGRYLIESVVQLFVALGSAPTSVRNGGSTLAHTLHRQNRTAALNSSRQHRHVRLNASKKKPGIIRAAKATGRSRIARRTLDRHGLIARRAQKASSS